MTGNFERNVANDKKHARDLKKFGWRVIVVWECQLKKPERVIQRLEKSFATKNMKRHKT